MSFQYFEAASHASTYNAFRHSPPQRLIKHIVDFIKEQVQKPLSLAVDVGCGSGQSTEILAPYFQTVIGIDPSESQIAEATKKNQLNNVTYRQGFAENIDLPKESVQLVTASQACHWFDLPKFYAEAGRLLSPGGVIALYGYLLPKPLYGNKGQELSNIVNKYYTIKLSNYVLPESQNVYIDNYRSEAFNTIPFIKGQVTRNESMSAEYKATVADLVGYVSSWSAFQNYQKHEGEVKADVILKEFEKEIMDAIGVSALPQETQILIQYNYFLIMGRK